MKNKFLIIFLCLFILHNLSGQEPVNTEYEQLVRKELEVENAKFKQNRFTVLLDIPSLAFYKGDWGFKTNSFKGIGTGFDYHFSEIMSLGLHFSFIYDHTIYTDTKDEEKLQTLNFTPVFKLNLGRNQIAVPFFKVFYTFSLGKVYYSYEENYTPNYMRHIIGGGVGLKIYASRWFKKTKYKNNFGIELGLSKALFFFDNSVKVDLIEREGAYASFFYRF